MQNEQEETVKLWRVYKTIHQMCHDRGYVVSQSELDMTLDQFKASFSKSGAVDRESLSFLVQSRLDAADQMLVFFSSETSIGVKPIRQFCEKMVTQGIQKAIVVYRQSITPSAAKVLTTMSSKYHLESFKESELLVNITEHVLVPKHVLLAEEEKKALLETQLPRIQVSDPVARYYGMKRGQVVKIIRPSETAGRYVTYRLCT